MAIVKSKINSILSDIFCKGNVIELFKTVPDEETESGEEKISGEGYKPYQIQEGDFNLADCEVTSAKNIMLYLCDVQDGHGTANGFGIYSSNNKLLYFGSFVEPMPIKYNTVPTIKKYSEEKGEGIKITVYSTEASASAE